MLARFIREDNISNFVVVTLEYPCLPMFDAKSNKFTMTSFVITFYNGLRITIIRLSNLLLKKYAYVNV